MWSASRSVVSVVAVVVLALAGRARAQPEGEAAGEDAGDGEGEEPAEAPAPATGTISGVVDAPELESPLAGATITVVGTKLRAVTDADGRYTLEVPPGKHKLRVEFGGFGTAERDVELAAGDKLEASFPLVTDQVPDEVIVVIGSRSARSNVETPVPVDIVTAQDIARTGRTETGRVLHTLAPSYISTPQTVADGSDHVDPASLRGLGPDQVLVLVNGKRRHRSALIHVNGTFGRGTVGTDLNAIPASSIKRIEILRDGAASQYGSDAIAGVINIVTKDDTEHVDFATLTGITGRGDGAQIKTGANYGFKIGDTGFVNLTGEFLQRGATNRSGSYTGTVYSDDRAVDDQMLAARGLVRDDFKMRIGEAAATAGIGAFSMELPLQSNAKFYSFGDVSYRNSAAAGFYRFPKQTSQTVAEFYPDGFLPEIRTNLRDAALTVGMRRKGTWDLDVSLTHGRNAFQFNIENSVNASLGTASPTTFDAGTLAFQQTVGNVDAVHAIDTKAVKKLAVVLGSEFRVESYGITAGDEASYAIGEETFGDPPQRKLPGAQVFPGFQPSNEVDRTRNNIGVYAGIESQPVARLTLDAGGRFEQYSDFGSSLIGKVAARAEIVKGVALRGAASTGFRAPSLHQLWFSNVSTQFLPDAMGVLQPTQVLTSNNQSPVTKAFGIPKLKEEKSINLSAGVAVRPLDNLSITADAYFIRIDDRIVLTSQFSNANPIVAGILAPFAGVSQAQFFANAVDTDTEGLDLVADYTIELDKTSTLAMTASANFTRTGVRRINRPGSLDPSLDTFFFSRQARNRIEDSVPHQRGTAALRYATTEWSAQVRGNYFGGVRFKPDNPDNDEVFSAKVLFDLSLGYTVAKHVVLTVGADNVFNTFPDAQTKEANISAGRFVYSRNVSQFGQNGGFYYAKLELSL